MSLFEFCIRRPVFATVLSLVLVLLGIVSYTRLTVREYPNVDEPVVSVSTEYPGASATIIESQITQVLEGSIAGIAGIDVLESTSRAESSRITVRFRSDVDPDVAASDTSGPSWGRRMAIQRSGRRISGGWLRSTRGATSSASRSRSSGVNQYEKLGTSESAHRLSASRSATGTTDVLVRAIKTAREFRSQPTARRPRAIASTIVVAPPIYGSTTRSPGVENASIAAPAN